MRLRAREPALHEEGRGDGRRATKATLAMDVPNRLLVVRIKPGVDLGQLLIGRC